MPKGTPKDWVDKLLRVGPADWVPPVPRYVEPDDECACRQWRHEWARLHEHHSRETDALYAVIRELVRRLEKRDA